MRKTRNHKKNRAKTKHLGRMGWYDFGGKGRHDESQAGIGRLKGVSDDARLEDNCLILAGLGAVGGKCFAELARMGVGNLFAIDPDVYEIDSWLTQPINRHEDLHRDKAVVQGAAAATVNPAVKILTARGLAQDLPWQILRRAELLVLAGDNLEMLVFMGKMAAAFGKPLLEGAVHGETFSAFVRHWNLTDADAACPACALGNEEWNSMRSRHGCDPGISKRLGTEPTHTLPFVCGAAASILAGEVVKCLLGDDQPHLDSEELSYSLKTHRLFRTPLERDAGCRCPHTNWTMVDVDSPPSQQSFRKIIEQFADSPYFQLGGELPWISFASCRKCENQMPVRRFGNVGDRLGHCSCGGELDAVPMGVSSVVRTDDLRACLDVPLDELGLVPGDALRISSEQQELCVFLDDPLSRASNGSTSIPVAAEGRERS